MATNDSFMNKINNNKNPKIKNKQREEIEEKLMTTVKNRNINKTSDLIRLSNSNKNKNNLLSIKMKSSYDTEKKNSKIYNPLSGRITKGNQKESSKNSLKLKKSENNSNSYYLNSLLNSNHINEGSSQSLTYLFKNDSSIDGNYIDSQQENHISLLNKKSIDLSDISKKSKNNFTAKNSLTKAKINNILNGGSSKKEIYRKSKFINKENIKNSPVNDNNNINIASMPKLKNRFYLTEIKDKNNLNLKMIDEDNNTNNNFKNKSYKHIKNILKSSKKRKEIHEFPFCKMEKSKVLKYRNSCSVLSQHSLLSLNKRLENEINIINKNNIKFNLINKRTRSKTKYNKKKVRKSGNYSLNNFPGKIVKRKSKRTNTFTIDNELSKKNLLSMMRMNKPNKINETKKIIDIIALDEIDKKIKQSLFFADRDQLKQEIKELETNEICEAIKKLPIINPNNNLNDYIINNKNKNNINENNTTNTGNNETVSNRAKYKYCKIKESYDIDNNLIETKLDISDKNRSFIRKKIIYDSLDDEEIEEFEYYYIYISPNSLIAYLIDSIILISVFIELLYVPIYISAKKHFCRNIFGFNEIMLSFIDIFYFIDLITEFFRAYYNFDEILIKNKKDICIKYLKNEFITDFLEAIPVYTILNISENKCGLYDYNYYSNFYDAKINKIQYILNIFKAFKIFKVFNKNTTLKKIKNFFNKSIIYYRYKILIYTFIIVAISINISSCLFIFIGRNSYPGWITENNLQNESFICIYVAAIYYIITTVTTVGYGDMTITTNNERINQIIILIVGTCAYSWLVTYISNHIKNVQEKYIDYDNKKAILNEIKLTNPNLSKDLYNKINRYLLYNRVEQKDNKEILINSLPYPLKNTLIMEMSKITIKNFKFFKSFENTNFIAKVVSSFKSILSIKGDIVMQDDEFVEDIFFVKNGIISLEISIDLNYTQHFIETCLKGTGFGQSTMQNQTAIKFGTIQSFKSSIYSNNSFIKNTLNSQIKNSTNSSSNYKYSIVSKQNENKINFSKINKRYIKIIDIRENEHFGDILMFSNEKSIFRAKVKSKKAELYLLSKTDTVEIATFYPNIWKRVTKNSLYNMNQIKNLSHKILKYFSEMNGIKINEDYSHNKETKSIVASSLHNKTITDNNEKSERSCNFCTEGKKSENLSSKKINNVKSAFVKSNLSKKTNENIETQDKSILINDKIKKSSFKISSNSLEQKSKLLKSSSKFLNPSEKYNNSSSISSSSSPRSICNNNKNEEFKKKLKQKISNEFQNNPKAYNKQFLKNNEHHSNKKLETSKQSKNSLENNKSINKINSTNNKKDAIFHFSDSEIATRSRDEQINCEIYPNEKLNDCEFLENNKFSLLLDNCINEFIKSDGEYYISQKNLKIDLNNQSFNKNNNIDIMLLIDNDFKIRKSIKDNISSNISNNNIKSKSIINQHKEKYFNNLSISKTTSETIDSSYYNINQITKNKFCKDLTLRNKTMQFLLEQCLENKKLDNFDKNKYFNSLNSIDGTEINIKNKIPNFISPRKKKVNFFYKPKRRIFSSEKLKIYSSLNSKKKENGLILNFPKSQSKPQSGFTLIEHNNSQKLGKTFDVRKVRRKSTYEYDKFHSEENYLTKFKHSKKNINSEENEMNFYGKMESLKMAKTNNFKTIFMNNKKKISFLDKITHNISENKLMLYDPQKFYTGFFTNLLQKKQTKQSNNIKIYKDEKTSKNNEINNLGYLNRDNVIKNEKNCLSVPKHSKSNKNLRRKSTF